MAWYKAGTVSVTQGNATVTGAGSLWVSGARIGHQWIGPDGLSYEITNIVSDTQLTIDPPYRGATAGGQTYRIAPTQDEVASAGRVMAELIGSMAAVRDTIGRGLVAAGTPAAPSFRGTADQDTGLNLPGGDVAQLVAGGVARLVADASGVRVNGTTSEVLAIRGTGARGSGNAFVAFYDAAGRKAYLGYGGSDDSLYLVNETPSPLIFGNGSAERGRFDTAGNLGVGTTAPQQAVHVAAPDAARSGIAVTNTTYNVDVRLATSVGVTGAAILYTTTSSPLRIGTSNAERLRVTEDGNLLVGTASGACHVFSKAAANGGQVAVFTQGSGLQIAGFYALDGSGLDTANAANAAMKVGKSSTGRSANFAGTVNAGGQDYAEYMRKAGACGAVAKGQIVGVDAKGMLTDKFSLAHSFVIKSTDPAYVGGDNWSPGPPPAEPILALPPYGGPPKPLDPGAAPAELPMLADRPVEPVRLDGEEDLAFIRRMARWIVEDAAWVDAMNARPAEVEAQAMAETAHVEASARYEIDLAAWQKATAAHATEIAAAEKKHAAAVEQYKTDTTAWDAKMEAARQCVDRVAFSGQVPVNVAAGTFKPGDYIIGAKGKNDEIVGVVVTNAAMRLTPGQRCDAVGKVWRVMEDGRAWVAVLIG